MREAGTFIYINICGTLLTYFNHTKWVLIFRDFINGGRRIIAKVNHLIVVKCMFINCYNLYILTFNQNLCHFNSYSPTAIFCLLSGSIVKSIMLLPH